MRYHQDSGIGLFSADERFSQLTQLGDPLLVLSRHIDFEFFRATLETTLYAGYESAKGGRPPFDPVMMFKILVIQRLYNLSDDATEFQIKDRLSFMRFLGLDFSGRVPDAKTIWLFREQLQKHGLVQQLFDHMNADLERRNIITHSGKIVDASFVEAPRGRNTREQNQAIKSGEIPPEWKTQPHRLAQKDTDARWAKKGAETHFGYKDHLICDRRSKLVVGYQVTDAAVHDSVVLDSLLTGGAVTGETIYADAAYRSAQIETALAGRQLKSRIHFKAARNRALSARQKKSNTARSRHRARVEHIFGFIENSMRGSRVRGRSLARNAVVIALMNLTYNLCRVMQLKRELRPCPA